MESRSVVPLSASNRGRYLRLITGLLKEMFDAEVHALREPTETLLEFRSLNPLRRQWPWRELARTCRLLPGIRLEVGPERTAGWLYLREPLDRKMLGLLAADLIHLRRRCRLEVELEDTNAGIIALWNEVESERKNAQQAKDIILELNRSKDRFMAALAHELRNPLAAIVLASEELMEEEAEAPASLKLIHRQGRQLGRLVDDLLQVSRALQRKLRLKTEAQPLRRSLGAALEAARLEAQRRGVGLEHELPPDDVWVEGDEYRLVQVWSNLLDNGLKYTGPGGTVRVRYQMEDQAVQIRFEDDGRGFAPDAVERIFSAFAREEEEVESQVNVGLGLGLSLVKQLVELHGGEVTAESEGQGKGATFTVRLRRYIQAETTEPSKRGPPEEARGERPTSRASASSRSPAQEGVQTRPTLLLAEDNEDLRELMVRALERRGVQVEAVGDGLEALERLRGQAYDVMLFDLGLPGMDGLELGRHARQLRPDARLVAATGHGSNRIQTQTQEAGFDLHLVKPIDVAKLVRWLHTET